MTELDSTEARLETTGGAGTTRRDLVVVLTATLAALMTWSLWALVLDTDLVVGTGDSRRTVGLASVMLTALVVSAAGVLLLRLLALRSDRPLRTWTAVAVTVCVLSLLGPLGATSAGGVLALASLHLVVGGVVVFGLRRAHARTA